MLLDTLRALFARDLGRLQQEIELYQNEASLWRIDHHIANSAGNLCLHLVGNLNTFIGAELGQTGYVRHRDLEFSLKDVPRAELIQKVVDTRTMVDQVLSQLNPARLDDDFPKEVLPGHSSAGFVLVHLSTHLTYHLGQINYHRRLLDTF